MTADMSPVHSFRRKWLVAGIAAALSLAGTVFLLYRSAPTRMSAGSAGPTTDRPAPPVGSGGAGTGAPAATKKSEKVPEATPARDAESRSSPLRAVFRSGLRRTENSVTTQSSGARSVRLKISGNTVFASGFLAAMLTIPDGADDENAKAIIQKALRDIYGSYGFVKAQIGVAAIDGEPGSFSVSIEEGAFYRWAPLTIKSDSVPVTSLLPNFSVQEGHPANIPEFRQDLNSLALRYRERGYLDFTYQISQKIDDAQSQVGMTVRIVEGLRYVIGAVDLPIPRQSVTQLIGQPYSDSLVEYHLTQAGLSLQNVSLELNRLSGTVTIKTKHP